MTDNSLPERSDENVVDELIRAVGARVRSIRSRRGLTRKNLAFHSGVSERYLAQVEQSSANISLALLSRIATALGVHVGDLLQEQMVGGIKYAPLGELIATLPVETQQEAYRLLRDAFCEDHRSYKGVALTGLRGGGKSTLGEALAKHFQVPFVRLQDITSKLAGMEMGELISLTGQGVYRELEQQALKQTIADYHRVVVETGGSLVSEPDTYSMLREEFFTVWVRALPEDHMNRVIRQGDMRPMANNQQAMEDLKLILDERDGDYCLADHQVMTSGHSVESSLATLIEACAPILGTGNEQ